MLGAGLDLAPSAARSVRGTAAPVPSLDLNFLYGVLPAGVTFARASTAGYTDVNGAAQTAAIDQPRLTADGLLVQNAALAGAAEIVTVGVLSPWFNQAAGTLVVETRMLQAAPGGVQQGIARFDDGTDNNVVTLFVAPSGSSVFAVTKLAGVLGVNSSPGTYSAPQTVRAGLAWSAGSSAYCMNGGTVGTSASANVPASGMTRMILGGSSPTPGVWVLNGALRRVRCYASRLTNGQLQALTA